MGNNLLFLVNKYTDIWKQEPDNLTARAKAEKYAKIIAKTIILSERTRPHSAPTRISTTRRRDC